MSPRFTADPERPACDKHFPRVKANAGCARLCALACAAALLSSAVSAHAVEGRSPRAEALSGRAAALLAAGQVDAACAKFEASEALKNDLGTLLRLGNCYERADRRASAWHTFLAAEAMAQAEKDDDRATLATQRVAALEPKLARVVFIVPQASRVPSLTVQLGENTIPISAWGTTIPVDAGTQRIIASAKGYRTWTVDLTVSSEEGREYRITVPALESWRTPKSHHRTAYRAAGMVASGVGLASIGAGAVFSAFSRSNDDALTCARGVIQCTPGRASNGSSNYSTAAAVSYVVGGALVATGFTLFVLAPSPDHQEKNALRLAAHVASNGGRLQLEGAW